VGKLLGGATSVNCGGLLIKHPEKHSAAPDMNPVLKNLRRETLLGDRWLMLVPPAYTLTAKVSGGKQPSQAAYCGAGLLSLNAVLRGIGNEKGRQEQLAISN
jgi:hypothetical protein